VTQEPVARRRIPWRIVQRRVRRLAPRPVARADLRAFRAVARTRLPLVGAALPRLSRAADESRLWLAIAGVLAVTSGTVGRRAAARGVIALALTSALVNGPAKVLTGRGRPHLEPVPELRRLAVAPTSTSFPSGHAASAFAFATAVGREHPRLRWPLYSLATAVAYSRVYTGVHYPGDVLVGGLLGVAVARLVTSPGRSPRAAWQRATASPTPDRAPVDADGEGLVLVANASAGNTLGAEPHDRLREALPAARTLETDAGEDLPAALRRAASAARVIGVAGGDGSASTAAEVAAERGLPLLVVAGGTLNHLARDLGMEDVDRAIDAVREGRTIRVDLAEIDARPYVNAASIGLYPALVAAREQLETRIGKWPAALWCALRILATEVPTELVVDGRRRRVWLLWIGNGRFVDEGLAPHRRARLDEGVLDVRVVGAELPWSRARLALALLRGRPQRSPVYERWTADRVEVRSLQGPLQMAKDGEILAGATELVVAVRPRALRLLQPSDRPRTAPA
jgi:diacylglycerol kinase family enzyme/membrane-associated phospholipid phosphatase